MYFAIFPPYFFQNNHLTVLSFFFFYRCPFLSEAWNHLIVSFGLHRGTFVCVLCIRNLLISGPKFFFYHLPGHIVSCRTLYYWFLVGKWTKKKGPQDGISDQKLLIDCEHCCICIVDDQQRWQRLMQLTQWSSAVPWTGTFHTQFQWPNTFHGLWCLCEDSKPKSTITDCQPLSWCFKEHVYIYILGPHEYIWNSMYLQIIPQIVSAEGGEEMGFVDFIWDLCIPHMERNSTESENKREQTNLWA